MSVLRRTILVGSSITSVSIAYQLFVFWLGTTGWLVTSLPSGAEAVLGLVLPATLAGRLVAVTLTVPGVVYPGLVVWSALPSLSRALVTVGRNSLLALLWKAVVGG